MRQHPLSLLVRRIKLPVRFLGCLALCLVVTACGSSNTQYILQIAPPPCTDDTGRSLETPMLALKEFTTMPGMDRTAVFLATNNVIQPSTIWYWEGNPAEVVTQAVSDRLRCEGPYRILWPYAGKVDHVAELRGRVREFYITQNDNPEFTIGLTVELWSPGQKELLGEKTIRTSVEANSLTPQDTAEAASQAIADATGEISAWLENTKARVFE